MQCWLECYWEETAVAGQWHLGMSLLMSSQNYVSRLFPTCAQTWFWITVVELLSVTKQMIEWISEYLFNRLETLDGTEKWGSILVYSGAKSGALTEAIQRNNLRSWKLGEGNNVIEHFKARVKISL
jgi:hypothetical protein